MAEFTFDLDLNPYAREQAVRHFEQTYHMCFGGQERITENYFRQPPGSCPDQSPPAVALRDLTDAVRAGGPVRLKLSMGRNERVRFSAALEQTAARPGREGNDELARALGHLWREYDRQLKIPADEFERAERILVGG